MQTFCKIVENNLNNLPLGYSYGRSDNNSPLLKVICPNILRIGRLNTRVVQGPVRLPKGPSELMMKVEERYKVFYKLWNTTYIPKLIQSSKWFKSGSQLGNGDIVFFKKTEGPLASDWIIGKVVDCIKGKDGVIRRIEIQYQNATEDSPRFTKRGARSVVKLFNLEDTDTWVNDMDEVEKLLKVLEEEDILSLDGSHCNQKKIGAKLGRSKPVQHVSLALEAKEKIVQKLSYAKTFKCSNCCCSSHCGLTGHNRNDVRISSSNSWCQCAVLEFSNLLDGSWSMVEEYVEMLEEDSTNVVQSDLTSLLTAFNMDFDI